MATLDTVGIESVAAYWNARPCNIRHSPKAVGSREYFDEVEARKYFVEPHIPAFAEFPRWAGKRVLEIGCGIGTDTINFARHGACVTAIDLSQKSLDIARRRAEVFGFQNQIQFFQGSAEELQSFVPVEEYDLVYSFGVIHHTPHPERVLDQFRPYLHPGSVVKVMVYHRHATKVLGVVLGYGKGRFWRLKELVARHSEAQTGCPVTYIYSRRQARALLENHGLEVTDLRVEHIFPYRIADYVSYRYRKVWYYRWMPAWLFRSLERRWGWHVCMTARPARIAGV